MSDQFGNLTGNTSTVRRKKAFLKVAALNRGNITKSIIAANVGRRTFYNWIDQDPEFAAQFDDVLESLLDFVMDQALALISGIPELDEKGKLLRYKLKPDPNMIQFYLRTRGRSRGFTEHSELGVAAHIPFIHDSVAVSHLIQDVKKH